MRYVIVIDDERRDLVLPDDTTTPEVDREYERLAREVVRPVRIELKHTE